MKKILLLLFVLVAVAACGKPDTKPVQHCGGYDVNMSISDDGAAMHADINGDELDLSLVPSASGAKYAGILNDTLVVLWEKGGVWTMMLDDETIIDCHAK